MSEPSIDENKVEQDARDEMAKGITEYILDPLGLLAGLLAYVDESVDDGGCSLKHAGILLGLALYGAQKELEIQRIGIGAYTMNQWLEH
jgi:hypothetical protein